MQRTKLSSDPYNVIITGVGGQGNVTASRVVGGMLSCKGFNVTIGETFGASQRGGSVMSHLRISADLKLVATNSSKAQSHLLISLEPTEAIRVLEGLWQSEDCRYLQYPADPFHRCYFRRSSLS